MSIFNIPPGFIRPPKEKRLPKFIDALELTESDVNYTSPVKKDPETGLLYTDLGYQIQLIDQAFTSINARIDDLVESTTFESALTDLWAQININKGNIDDNRLRINELTNVLSEAYDILGTKLNKVWSDVALANELGDNDYFVINSGSNAYKITFSQFKNLVGGSSEGGVNHYKGDFLSYSALINATYDGTITPQAGDYAFVNTTDYTTETPKDYLVMYIWDVDADAWKETTSDKYVQSIVFDDFQYDLLNGLLVVHSALNAEEAGYANTAGRSVNADNADEATHALNADEATIAHSYINSDGVESSISESFDSKQNKLIAGAGISISEDGTISVSYPDGDEEVY